MNKILVPVDNSEFSKRAVEKAKEIAKAFNSEITIIHVIESHMYYTSKQLVPFKENFVKVVKEKSNKLLKEYKDYFKDIDVKTDTHLLEGNPSNEIIKLIETRDDIDLVIMGSNGISGFKSFLGSTTNRVIHHIDKPILIVK